MIEPFANNHQSMQIGELIIENQLDKVIIYGDIDLYLNETGYEQAKKLHELTGKIVQYYAENNHKKSDQAHKSDDRSELNDERLEDEINNPFL